MELPGKPRTPHLNPPLEDPWLALLRAAQRAWRVSPKDRQQVGLSEFPDQHRLCSKHVLRITWSGSYPCGQRTWPGVRTANKLAWAVVNIPSMMKQTVLSFRANARDSTKHRSLKPSAGHLSRGAWPWRALRLGAPVAEATSRSWAVPAQ